MMAEYDYKNPIALQSLIKNGVKLQSYSTEIMKAAATTAFEMYEEEAAKNPSFKKIYESWRKFRADILVWHRVAEQTYSTFAFNNPPKN
jgi:TRAP-type mannitol/chloroaromatic compound transport system substrate-binding protein